MPTKLRVPAAYDTYDLQSVLVCTQCGDYLVSRPVTTRCGKTFCRNCLIQVGECPYDACRSYSTGDCPHDVVLGDLLEEIQRIVVDGHAKGVWRKRKRTTHGPESLLEPKGDKIPTESKRCEEERSSESPDSLESLQLRYKKVDNESSPSMVVGVFEESTMNITPDIKSPDVSQRAPTDLNLVDEALFEEKTRQDSASAATVSATFATDSSVESTDPSKPISKMMEKQARQESDTEDNDLWKVLRRNVAESFFICSVCSNCFLEPMTLRCGHTFCRECLHHSIDQSSYNPGKGFCQPTCPSCRNMIGPLLPKGEAPHHENTWNWTNNLHMWKLINRCWIPELEESKSNFKDSTKMVPDGMEYPLFVCTTGLPTQPTDLRVFEPKYRTMLRRVLRSKDRIFAMALGTSDPIQPFRKVGVLLQIKSVVYQELEVDFPRTVPPTKDMETYVFTRGISRISIEEAQEHDGYLTVRTTQIEDNTLEMEAIAELQQVGYMRVVDPMLSAIDFDPQVLSLDWLAAALPRYSSLVTRLRTSEVVSLLSEFVRFEERRSGPTKWTRDVLENRGPVPENPALFSWWFIGVFFSMQSDRQLLLEMTSPRQRLIYLLTRVGYAWPRIRQ
jgi:Lon protease-like protein/formylmethanofuran dehydrogenase subunit E